MPWASTSTPETCSVGHKDHFVARQRPNDIDVVGGRDADVTFRLDGGRDAVREAAAGAGARVQDALGRVDNLGRFGHEAHAAKQNRVRIGFGGGPPKKGPGTDGAAVRGQSATNGTSKSSRPWTY